MRKNRFTEAQIIGMIKEQEAGMPPAEVCGKHGLSQALLWGQLNGATLDSCCKKPPPLVCSQRKTPAIFFASLQTVTVASDAQCGCVVSEFHLSSFGKEQVRTVFCYRCRKTRK